jgi:hypothetical protein
MGYPNMNFPDVYSAGQYVCDTINSDPTKSMECRGMIAYLIHNKNGTLDLMGTLLTFNTDKESEVIDDTYPYEGIYFFNPIPPRDTSSNTSSNASQQPILSENVNPIVASNIGQDNSIPNDRLPLDDSSLAEAEDWFIELACPDFNIDTIEGIDTLQNNLLSTYDKVQCDCRDRLNDIEMKISTVLTHIESLLTQIIHHIESYLENITQKVTITIESNLISVEENIQQLTNKLFDHHEETIQKTQEETNASDTSNNDIPYVARGTDKLQPNNREMESRDEEILRLCCSKFAPLNLKLDEGQLQQIVNAIKSITINLVTNNTKVDKVENMDCKEEFPSDDAYDLSECMDNDLKAFAIRKDFDKYWPARAKSLTMPESAG